MKDLYSIYYKKIPKFLLPYLNCQEMIRLKDVGMNCGLEYTSFPFYKDLSDYSRFQHSLSVSLIIYNFTFDKKQTLAGLFHDIATPSFAHVIDFLNHDYLRQESTEEKTLEIISSSKDILDNLKKDNININEISNYHLYPIADNDQPKLSSDRLEYTLANFVNFQNISPNKIKEFYSDLIVSKNEFNELELCFKDENLASEFAHLTLFNSKIYTKDENRYSMEVLARIIKRAIDKNYLTRNDLYKTETEVINLLFSHSDSKYEFLNFRKLSKIKKSTTYKKGYLKIDAKKRYIDPFVINKGRVSSFNKEVKKEIDEFKNTSFDYYLSSL